MPAPTPIVLDSAKYETSQIEITEEFLLPLKVSEDEPDNGVGTHKRLAGGAATFWDGTQWINYSTGVGNLQQVTDIGADTDNNITTYKTILEDVAQFIATASASSLSSLAALQAFISNPGSGNTSFAQLLLQANVARIIVQAGVPLQIYNDAGTKLFEVAGNGLSVTFANGVRSITGTGDPNGIEAAPPGSSFSRIDGSAGETYYIKQSGTGNTGWAPIA